MDPRHAGRGPYTFPPEHTSCPHSIVCREHGAASPAYSLVNLPQKHRDAQPLARGLAWEELVLALRQMSALAVMLRMGVGEEARAQEHGMLPVFLAQRVHTLI